MLRVDEIKDFDSFLTLENSWNSLVEKSPSNSVFLRHEWIRCWWEAYGKGKRLAIQLFREGDDLKGIAPLMISKVVFRGLPVRRISFIENDETPQCGFIEDPSYDIFNIIEALFNHLSSQESRWDLLFLRKVHEENPFFYHLERVGRARGYHIITRPIFFSPVLNINSDWQSFYSGKSRRFRKKIRYDQNKLKRAGRVKVQLFDRPEQIADNMEDVFRIGCRSWQGKIGSSIGSTRRNRLFFSQLPRSLGNGKNGIMLWALSLDGTMISFEYHVRQCDTVYALRGEFDGNYKSIGPGVVLDHEVVRTLFNDGIRLYNMCGDSKEQYKLRWTSEVQPYNETLVFKRGPYAKFLAFWETRITPIAKRHIKLIRGRHFRF